MARSEMQRFPEPWMIEKAKKPRWGYTHGLVVKSMLEEWKHTGDSTYYEYAKIYADSLIDADGHIKTMKYLSFNIDNVNGGKILFVGTKKQAQDSIKAEAERCGMYYVNQRWLGGMLTNFETIKTRIAKLEKYETMEQDGTFDVLPKKEVIEIKKEMEKLQKNLGGIKDMKDIPDMIFIVDPRKERNCVHEAHTLGIPLVGIADTNCDPEELDYVIPGNDDAIRAVKLIVSKMADAVIEANQGADVETAEEAESAEADAEQE